MITKVSIQDPTKSPIGYLSNVDNFKPGAEWTFTSGVNVIVGKNGSGKSTLVNLIRRYTLTEYEQTDLGNFNHSVNLLDSNRLDGVHVYGDYYKSLFNLCPVEKQNKNPQTAKGLAHLVDSNNCSYGESNLASLEYLFNLAFGEGTNLYFDYKSDKLKDLYPTYVEYVAGHTVECDDCWTFLLDEPDRNLDIENIDQIYGILKEAKEQCQLIAVIHNPVIIYKLMKHSSANFIEMTQGYLDSIKELFNNL